MQSDFLKEFPNLDEETIIEILMMLQSLEGDDPGVKTFDDFKQFDNDD